MLLEAAVSELTGNEYVIQDDEDEVVYERDDVVPEEDESPVSPKRVI